METKRSSNTRPRAATVTRDACRGREHTTVPTIATVYSVSRTTMAARTPGRMENLEKESRGAVKVTEEERRVQGFLNCRGHVQVAARVPDLGVHAPVAIDVGAHDVLKQVPV